jgi:hypothetical protein
MATTHVRRSPEQIVADYEAKIAAVKARAAAKATRQSPEGAAFLVAARSIQKAVVAAKDAKDEPKERALETALASLSAHAAETGMRMPHAAREEGRRPPEGDHRSVAPQARAPPSRAPGRAVGCSRCKEHAASATLQKLRAAATICECTRMRSVSRGAIAWPNQPLRERRTLAPAMAEIKICSDVDSKFRGLRRQVVPAQRDIVQPVEK